MSTTFSVSAGDTFESVARKVYGNERDAQLIARANPGTLEPLSAGATIIVPANPRYATDQTQTAVANDGNEVAILVDGVRFRFWQAVRLVRSFDAMDVLEFSAPFDATKAEFRAAFRPFSYKNVDVTVGGAFLFRGTMVAVTPVLSASKTIQVSCYSRPGVLNDCTAPASAFPLEFNGLTLAQITEQLCALFGLSSVFLADAGAAFERVALDPDEKVLDFIVGLAKQRNLVVSSDAQGALTFAQSAASSPVARLSQGASPLVAVSPFFSPQDYYSHITGVEPVVVGGEGSQYTVKNSRLTGVIRPLTFKVSDVSTGDVKNAVGAKASRMFANMVAYVAEVSTWRTATGQLWAPGQTVEVTAPDAMVYGPYMLIIRSVEFSRKSAQEGASLTLVLPEAFNGNMPARLPWDE